MRALFSAEARLAAARRLCEELAPLVNAPVGVRLWDGSVALLGDDSEPAHQIEIAGPGVLGSLLRRPTAANLLRLWAAGQVGFVGDPYEAGKALRSGPSGRRIGPRTIARLLGRALPLALTPPPAIAVDPRFAGDSREQGEAGEAAGRRIHFHYDVPSEFFALFLGPQMQYSCGYYPAPDLDLARAQEAKLDRICHKLQLEPGERLLDVGCGWGGLVCHAAERYGVRAVGVTLSREQLAHARRRVAAAGLQDRVELELRDWRELDGSWDKIASIEMCEHVGVDRLPAFFGRLHSCLRGGGSLLIQATARRARKGRRRRPSRDTRLLQQYLLPGIEVIEIGRTVHDMECAGLEIHHVEGLRQHYARTARAWSRNLYERREQAVALVGEEAYRLWLLLVTGLALTYGDGSNQVFQVLASRYRKRLGPARTSSAEVAEPAGTAS